VAKARGDQGGGPGLKRKAEKKIREKPNDFAEKWKEKRKGSIPKKSPSKKNRINPRKRKFKDETAREGSLGEFKWLAPKLLKEGKGW